VLGWAQKPGLGVGFCRLACEDAKPSPLGGLGLGWAWLELGPGLVI